MEKININRWYHPYPAVWIFVFYAAGIAAGWLSINMVSLVWIIRSMVFCFIILVIVFFCCPKYLLLPAGFLLFMAGLAQLNLQLAVFPSEHLVYIPADKISAVSGIIKETEFRQNGKNRYLFECDSVFWENTGQKTTGTVLLYQGKAKKQFHIGDMLKINASPQEPPLPANPGAFNFRRYLQMKGIFHVLYLPRDDAITVRRGHKKYWSLYGLFEPLRQSFRKNIGPYIPEPTAAVIKALLLGERQDVDRSLLDSFRKTGVIHVLAISGLHVGFILLIFLLGFSLLRLPYRLKISASLVMLFLFVVLVNFKTPVVRASLMIFLYYLAQFMERKPRAINILAGAGLLILFFDPQQLLQPGFQFSFAAVFGIVYGYPRLRKMIPAPRLSGRLGRFFKKYVYEALLASGAAVIGTIPLTWYYYGTLQTGALFINLLVIPLIGLLVIVGFIFLPLSFIGGMIAAGTGKLLHGLFMFIETIISRYSEMPFVQIHLPHPSLFILLLLTTLLFLFFNSKKTKMRIWFIGLFMFFLLFNFVESIEKQQKLQYTQIDVRQGDGALVRFPDGIDILVDGGQNFPFDAAKRFVVPLLRYYGVKHLRYLVGTHNHNDHIGGFITILRTFEVDTLVLSPKPGKSKYYKKLLKEAQQRNIPVVFRRRGQQLYVGNKCRVYILHPIERFLKGGFSGREVNNSSLVLKIIYGQSTFLLTGDLEMSAEEALVSYDGLLKAQVLKVGHHGSVTSTSQHFLDLVRPRYALVSVGKGNKYHHPGKNTIRRLRQNGIAVLRTDHFGALVFESDGQELRFINWREW